MDDGTDLPFAQSLHPEHFLPSGCLLMVYNHMTGSYNGTRTASQHQLVRLKVATEFNFCIECHKVKHWVSNTPSTKFNVYIIALNAEIEFHCYFEMVEATLSLAPLPDHVLSLMHRIAPLTLSVCCTGGLRRQRTLKGKGFSLKSYRCLSKRPQNFHSLADVDLEAQIALAYGRAMMSGHEMLTTIPPCLRARSRLVAVCTFIAYRIRCSIFMSPSN